MGMGAWHAPSRHFGVPDAVHHRLRGVASLFCSSSSMANSHPAPRLSSSVVAVSASNSASSAFISSTHEALTHEHTAKHARAQSCRDGAGECRAARASVSASRADKIAGSPALGQGTHLEALKTLGRPADGPGVTGRLVDEKSIKFGSAIGSLLESSGKEGSGNSVSNPS